MIPPPRVSGLQWLLAGFCLLIAAASDLATSYADVAGVLVPLAGLSGVLVLSTGVEALRTRAMGKVTLVASTFAFFWLEAMPTAWQTWPFEIPSDVPLWSGQFSLDFVKQSYLYISVFQFMLLVGYSIRPQLGGFVAAARSRIDQHSIITMGIKWGIVACAWLPVLLTYGFRIDASFDALVASRSGNFDDSSIGPVHYLTFLGMYGTALLLTDWLVFRGWAHIPTAIAALAAAVPFVMLGGTRHLLLFVALPAAALFLTRLKRLTLLRAARWGLLGVVLLVLFQLQFLLRSSGGWSGIQSVTPQQLLQTNTTGQYLALLFAESIVPTTHDYFHEPAEPYFLIHWIPRGIWPDKPVMESWSYYNDTYVQGRNLNVTPSIIGQFHINWGFPGVVFIGIWLGFLTYATDRLLLCLDTSQHSAVGVAVGMFYAFIVSSFRFYSPIYFTYFVFGVLGMLLLTTDFSVLFWSVEARTTGEYAFGSGARAGKV